MWKTFKQLQEYWSFLGFCIWIGNWEKASWICDNRIMPLEKEHPILSFIASII